MKAICALCDELIGDDVDPFQHYESRHPERFRGEWELRTWPDGEQVLMEEAPQ